MRSLLNRGRPRLECRRSNWPTRAIAAAADGDVRHHRPVDAVVMISGMEPRSKAITGVPQAMASTTQNPNGSSKSIRWSRATAPPRKDERSSARTGPTNCTRSPSMRGTTSCSKYVLVLNDPGDPEWDSRLLGDVDRRDHSLVRMDAPEEGQVGTGRLG